MEKTTQAFPKIKPLYLFDAHQNMRGALLMGNKILFTSRIQTQINTTMHHILGLKIDEHKYKDDMHHSP